MFKKFAPFIILAIVAALIPMTIASGEGNQDSTPATCDRYTATFHIKKIGKLSHATWDEKRWRRGINRKTNRQIHAHVACLKRGKDRKVAQQLRNKQRDEFKLYRVYRNVTPFRCHRGMRGTYAIPCYIIECESHFDWFAYNSSGASWIYQLLGWGAPYPGSWRAKVQNHIIAHEIYTSQGSSPWVCS